MLRLASTFDVKETGVESTEPFHVPMVGAMTSRRAQLGGTATGFLVSSLRAHRAIFRIAGRTALQRVGFFWQDESGSTHRREPWPVQMAWGSDGRKADGVILEHDVFDIT